MPKPLKNLDDVDLSMSDASSAIAMARVHMSKALNNLRGKQKVSLLRKADKAIGEVYACIDKAEAFLEDARKDLED